MSQTSGDPLPTLSLPPLVKALSIRHPIPSREAANALLTSLGWYGSRVSHAPSKIPVILQRHPDFVTMFHFTVATGEQMIFLIAHELANVSALKGLASI
ncbi:hypothetical protein EVAR_28325_1 [Eumeta japonica]|uniref:Uncharacterized protein n=1 Tax=Eumeta variegata TaxID=151549 RepID=A0A4C1V933_EUMVA|nr:hypothetical protein EVAR_28325_1 [Eumeta japonica]